MEDPLAIKLGHRLRDAKMTLSTAESCTGGGIAALITSVPGSSAYFNGGIVAYSNTAKRELLRVKAETLARHGAVSRETVVEMAKGAQQAFHTDCAIASSGIAGPDGGTPAKPVGTIYLSVAIGNRVITHLLQGDHGRTANVGNAIQKALRLLIDALDEQDNDH